MTVVNFEPKKQTTTTSFEVALAETEFGQFNYFVIIVSGIIIYNTVLEAIGISYALPIAEWDLNLSQQQKSLLSGISFVGIICSSHLWGLLADTLGRRRIMIPSLIIAFLITILSSFSVNFGMLVFLRFMNGIFICGSSATIFAYLSEFHIGKNRNKAIMAASFISAVLAISFPFVALLIINQSWQFPIDFLGIIYKPWRLYIVSCGMLGLLGSICLWKSFESPKFLLCVGKEEKSLEILKKIFTINTKKDTSCYSISHLECEQSSITREITMNKETSKSILLISKLVWQQTAPLFSKKMIHSTGLLCFMQFCVFVTAHGIRMWMPEILNSVEILLERNNTTTDVTICQLVQYKRNLIYIQENKSTVETERVDTLKFGTIKYSVIFEAVYPIVFLVVASGMKVIGRVKILFLILMTCGSCGILSALINKPIVGISLYLIQLLVGIGATVINSLSVELFPTHLKTMAVSLALMFGRLGSVFGSNVSGLLITNNCESVFIGSGVLLIFCGFLGFLLPKPDKSSEAVKIEQQNTKEDVGKIYITRL